MSDMLVLDGVVAGYGRASVLHGVSLSVGEGEVAVILGANGVGKTTTLRTVVGLVRMWAGTILYDGRSIERLGPERLIRAGIGIVPEPPGVFVDMPVVENLRVGGFALGHSRGLVEDRLEEVLDSLPTLRDRAMQGAGSLSGGERRLLAVGRALMGSPRLLLVDEASMGLSPTAVTDVMKLIVNLRNDGVTVCMVEQHISALDIADRAYVMEKGRIVHDAVGDLSGVRDQVARTYLGSAAEPAERVP